MTDKHREAHNKGQEDFKEPNGLPNSNPLTESFHPTYDPPSGYEEEYGKGWNHAKKQQR